MLIWEVLSHINSKIWVTEILSVVIFSLFDFLSFHIHIHTQVRNSTDSFIQALYFGTQNLTERRLDCLQFTVPFCRSTICFISRNAKFNRMQYQIVYWSLKFKKNIKNNSRTFQKQK